MEILNDMIFDYKKMIDEEEKKLKETSISFPVWKAYETLERVKKLNLLYAVIIDLNNLETQIRKLEDEQNS